MSVSPTRVLICVSNDLLLLAVVSDRGCAEAMRRHGGSRVVGVLSTDDPEFLLDGLQAAREGAGWAERLLVLVQGADRAVEELMRCGLAGEQILEDFVVSVGRRWTVSVTAGTALPRSLRGLCSTTACWGSSARSDYALAHPRTGRELAPHLALLEGSMVPVPGPCGLLVADTTTSRNEAETRRPRPRALKPFPARLVWSVPSSEDELAPASGGAAGSWPLLLGAQAPFLEECVLPLAPGEIVGVAADAADGTRFLEALRIFNPWADFLVRGAAAPPSNRRGDEAADRPRIAILSAAHDLLASDHAAADAFLRAADAAILVFDPQRFLPSRTPWAADLRTAGHGVVLGPRLGIEGSFRAEECPKSIGTPAEGTGILLSRAGRKRFMIAVPGEDRGTDPSHAAAWPPDAGTNHRDGIRR